MADVKITDEASGLYTAFLAAWADCKNPALDSANPHFRNRFASLGETLRVVREACAAHGLRYGQTMVRDCDGSWVLASHVANAGEVMGLSQMPIDMGGTPQQRGSCLTYAKRQLAQLDWGIVGEDDDDGEAGSEDAPALTAAKQRLARVCAVYESAHPREGATAGWAARGVMERADYADHAADAAWFEARAAEFGAEV